MFRMLTTSVLIAAFALPAIAQEHIPHLAPSRVFTTTTTPGGNTHVQFGNGTTGQEPNIGSNNVTGTYRLGGSAGKVSSHRHHPPK